MVYSINYDLNNPGQNYEKVRAAVEALGPAVKALHSTFLLHSTLDATQVWTRIAHAFDQNDRCLISEITHNNAGWMGQNVWNWINARRAA